MYFHLGLQVAVGPFGLGEPMLGTEEGVSGELMEVPPTICGGTCRSFSLGYSL
jgi:hypothetical protein